MNMLSNFPVSRNCLLRTAAIALTSSLLISCDEKEQSPASPAASAEASTTPSPAPAPALEATATPAATPAVSSETEEAKEKLFSFLLTKNHALMSNYAGNPVFTAAVRDALELMQAYYDTLAAEKEVSLERFELAYTIAKSCRDLTAYARAATAYEIALADYNALAADVRNTSAMKSTLSSIYNGIASCLLTQAGKQEEAASYYDKQLAMDQELYNAAKPDEAGQYPEGVTEKDYFTAISNLISSYRCKGDSLVTTDELEDARDIYKKGPELMKSTTRITPQMLFEYVELLSALGNLESRCGNTQPAVAAWTTALKLCAQINQQSKNAAEKLRSKNYYERLKPLVEKGTAELQAAQEEVESLEDDITPTIMPSEEAAEEKKASSTKKK